MANGHASASAPPPSAGSDHRRVRPPRRRVKTPTVLQMEAVECGAAALASVLAYFGKWVTLEQLRYECGVSRDGSKANEILKAARMHGLVAKGFRMDLEKLYTLTFPVILFWNFSHFLVLEGFKRERVFLNDPAEGPRVVSLDELDGAFSGIVLTFERGPDFRKGGAPPTIIPALLSRLAGVKWALTYTIVCGLFLVIPGLLIPTFTRVFIDDYFVGDQRWLLRPLLLAMLATLVVQGLLTWLQRYYLLRLETRIALSTSSRFFSHILRLPATYFAQRFSGEIGSRVLINDEVAHLVSGTLASTVIDTVMIVFYAVFMYLYDAVLTVVVVSIALLNVAVVKLSARARVNATRRLMQDRGKLTGVALNGLQIIETIKATGSESEFFARWAGHYAKTVNTEQYLRVPVADIRDGARLRPDAVDVGGPRAWRSQGDERWPHRRDAGRLPDAARQLHPAAGHVRLVRFNAAGASGADESAGRRAAVSAGPTIHARSGPDPLQSRKSQALRQARAAERDVRLQPVRPAGDREFRLVRRARPSRRHCRRERQRQVDDCAPDFRGL